MNTINLGSGITLERVEAGAVPTHATVNLWWSGPESFDNEASIGDCSGCDQPTHRIRIPIALLEGRAGPGPAKPEPDWRGFAEIVGGGDTHRVYVRWHGVTYYLCRNSLWDCERGFTFSTFAEAEAALAKAKHPGESA